MEVQGLDWHGAGSRLEAPVCRWEHLRQCQAPMLTNELVWGDQALRNLSLRVFNCEVRGTALHDTASLGDARARVRPHTNLVEASTNLFGTH